MNRTNDLYQDILDHLFEGVYFVDPNRNILYWNDSAERITGYQRETILGRPCFDNILVHVDGRGTALCTSDCPVAKTILDGQAREGEIYLHHEQGHRVPVSVRVMPLYGEDGQITGAMEFFKDDTDRVVSLQRINQLQSQALLDPLTGLGNRRYAETRLQNAVHEVSQLGVPYGVLFADADHFKQVNDQYGHAAGDRVLRMIGQTLVHNIKTLDFAGRWGGEEFLLLLHSVSEPELAEIAKRLCTMVEHSLLSEDGVSIRATVSIGATTIRPGESWESVYQRADRLMYESKAGGRNRVTVG